jgi:hypothetical protein
MNINILANEDNFNRMSMMDIQKSHFIAFSDGNDTFAIMKNRIDGTTGAGISEMVVRSYISELVDASLKPVK